MDNPNPEQTRAAKFVQLEILQARICVARLLGLGSEDVWTEEGWGKVYDQAQSNISFGFYSRAPKED